MNIYIANLSFNVNDEDLRQIFEEYGEVESAKIIKDNFTGKSRGFGFVLMPNDEEANEAINNLNNAELNGKTLVVNEARPRNTEFKKPYGGGGGGGYNSRPKFGGDRKPYQKREGGYREGGYRDREGGYREGGYRDNNFNKDRRF